MQSFLTSGKKFTKRATYTFGQTRQPNFFRPMLEPKLTINPPNDVGEQEADAMAERVMGMPMNRQSFFSAKPVPSTGLQRQCAECEEEEKKLQRKQSSEQEPEASSEFEGYIDNLNSSGRSLTDNIKSFFEPRFGTDFSDVRIHTDSAAAKSAQSINALAYTTGNNIVFNDSQYAPNTDNGKKLLAHELTHVVQQNTSNSAGAVSGKNIDRDVLGTTPAAHGDQLRFAFPTIRQQVQQKSLIQRQYPPMPIIIRPSQTQSVEVTAMDKRVESGPWYWLPRYGGPLLGALGDVEMTNTVSMANNVIRYLHGRRMHRLNINDHGNNSGLEIGDDYITSANVSAYVPTLTRLRPHFESNGIAHFQNCDAGQNQSLICAIAAAFGVPVYAGTGLQEGTFFNFGDYVRCDPNGTFHPDVGRPPTPSSPVVPEMA
jgi:hypothetical protein